MKCRDCGYDNRDDALTCNMCRAVLRKERKAVSPVAAPEVPVTPVPREPTALDSPAAVEALLEHVLRVGREAMDKDDGQALRGEVPRLASRFFLELPPADCRKLVLEPVASRWLSVAVPALVSPEKNAKAKALIGSMLAAAENRRFGEALARLKAADAVPGDHNWPDLLVIGLGLKRASEKTEPSAARPAPAPPPAPPPAAPARKPPLQKGDVLQDRYEIHGVLGEGGFGIVYLAYHRPSQTVMALKTFRDEYLDNAETRALFRREGQILVDLDPHPHLVRAYLVDEIHGRLFIGLEFIAPDDDGLNTLEGHLRRRPPDLAQSLRWAVQFCHGMEFAEAHGLRCHRDIKPANIMIDAGSRVLISDFGLAGAVQLTRKGAPGTAPAAGPDGPTAVGVFGTPTHMPLEQFLGAERCDQRTDVYAFGVVLYQMATGGRVPFWSTDREHFWEEMARLHAKEPVPPLDTPLFPVIQRCLQKSPVARYQRFAELRQHLEALLRKTTGETAPAPEVKRREDADWDAKGVSLKVLGRYEEALACFDRALALAPDSSQSWNNKGAVFMRLGRWPDAIGCFDHAIALQDDAHPWANKSGALLRLGRHAEALAAAEAATRRDPRRFGAWANKGAILNALGRAEEACAALDRALAINPSAEEAWATKVAALIKLGRPDAALAAADECLSIHPGYAVGWTNKGYVLNGLGRHEEALGCFERAIALDPRLPNAWAGKRGACKALGRRAEVLEVLERELALSPEHGETWLDKGRELVEAERWSEALACMEKAVRFEPEWPLAWTNLGLCLRKTDRLDEAQAAYGKAAELNPPHVPATLARGDILRQLGRYEEASTCFESAIAAGPEKSSPVKVGAAWFYKGDCLHHLGRRDQAESCYARALELLPDQARGPVLAAADACRQGLPPPPA